MRSVIFSLAVLACGARIAIVPPQSVLGLTHSLERLKMIAANRRKAWEQTTEAPAKPRLLALFVSRIQWILNLLKDGGGGN